MDGTEGTTLIQSADWRATADTRIDRLRKCNLEICIVDSVGRAVPEIHVEIQQIQKSFPFGAAMGHHLLQNPAYQAFFRSYFNWAVFGNEAKWYANEPKQGLVSYAPADALLDWCEAASIPVRGHCIFWEPEEWQPGWLQSLNTQSLEDAVESRITSVVNHFRGRFKHWDVNNEMLHGRFFRDRLGADIWPHMFHRVRELDPDVQLFVNDFNVLSVDQNFTEVQTESYVSHIRQLLAQGTPIDGIGIQGHVWREEILSKPHVIQERLDQVAQLGIPIWISEFDCADADENARADKLELVYRTAYGHPMVEGIMLWVVWPGDSWRGPDAGLVDLDWTLNAAGRRFESLMREWSTNLETVTDSSGCVRFRGFPGRYEVSVLRPGYRPCLASLDIVNVPSEQKYWIALPARENAAADVRSDVSGLLQSIN